MASLNGPPGLAGRAGPRIGFHGSAPLLTHGQGKRWAFEPLPCPRVIKGIVHQGDLGRGLGVFKAAVPGVVDPSGARGGALFCWCQRFESQGFRGRRASASVAGRLGWGAEGRTTALPAEWFRHQGHVRAMRWLCAGYAPYVLAIAPEVDPINLGSNS